MMNPYFNTVDFCFCLYNSYGTSKSRSILFTRDKEYLGPARVGNRYIDLRWNLNAPPWHNIKPLRVIKL